MILKLFCKNKITTDIRGMSHLTGNRNYMSLPHTMSNCAKHLQSRTWQGNAFNLIFIFKMWLSYPGVKFVCRRCR